MSSLHDVWKLGPCVKTWFTDRVIDQTQRSKGLNADAIRSRWSEEDAIDHESLQTVPVLCPEISIAVLPWISQFREGLTFEIPGGEVDVEFRKVESLLQHSEVQNQRGARL